MKRVVLPGSLSGAATSVVRRSRDEWWKLAIVAVLPLVVVLAAIEALSRIEHRLRHGYSYAEAFAYVPHDTLVFHNNPRHHRWRHDPGRRYDFFFIPPLLDRGDPTPRIWVFGGSTSMALPDGSDWPTVFQGLVSKSLGPPLRVVNMGHGGYGIGHIRWLYDHYRDKVNPAAIIVFSGWNYRGIMSSPVFSHRPVNACSKFDGWLQCTSAFFINYSAAYGRLFHLYQRLRRYATADHFGDPPPAYPELAQWEDEYRETVRTMARTHPVFLVLFPGIAMRDDARLELPSSLRCIADHFDACRAEYEARIRVIRRIGDELGVPLLDVRSAYLKLPPRVHVSYFTDLAHQTPDGNRLLAEIIHAEFMRKWGTVPDHRGVTGAERGRDHPASSNFARSLDLVQRQDREPR